MTSQLIQKAVEKIEELKIKEKSDVNVVFHDGSEYNTKIDSDRAVFYNSALKDVQSLLPQIITGVIEEIEKIIRKEVDTKSSCQHRTPRGISANEYDCSDIHIGREEMASDILASLKEVVKE